MNPGMPGEGRGPQQAVLVGVEEGKAASPRSPAILGALGRREQSKPWSRQAVLAGVEEGKALYREALLLKKVANPRYHHLLLLHGELRKDRQR